jgi:hypothetical protein
LSVLGRSQHHFHPINLIEVRPVVVSRNAEAYVTRDPDAINLLTKTGVFDDARRARSRCGNRAAVAKIASILVHEEWHLRHGSDERDAYSAQLTTLASLGYDDQSGVYGSVKRAMLATLQRPPQVARSPD